MCSWKPSLGLVIFLTKAEHFPKLLPTISLPHTSPPKTNPHSIHFFPSLSVQKWTRKGHSDAFSAVSLLCDLMIRKSGKQPLAWSCFSGRLNLWGAQAKAIIL